jgi:hypothetical protein
MRMSWKSPRFFGLFAWLVPSMCSLAVLAACSGPGGSHAQGQVTTPDVGPDLPLFVVDDADGAADLAESDAAAPSADVTTVDVPDDVAASCPGGAACPCSANADCNGGLCIDTGQDAKACAVPCVASCPGSQVCVQVTGPSSDLVSICVAKAPRLCDPCLSSKECGSLGVVGSACVDRGAEGRFCGVACTTAADCPGGYACEKQTSVEGAIVSQCVPVGGAACTCNSSAIQHKASTPCWLETKNAVGEVVGKCPGVRSCGPEGLSACLAAAPTAESCNGLDDDCDGATDEGTCVDGNPCTEDSCGGTGGCSHAKLEGTPCDADGSACTEGDHCAGGTCTAGKGKDCGDGNPCTLDACLPAGGCTHTVDDGVGCDDDNPCTIGDVCLGGGCTAGKAKDCAVSEACTFGKCSLISGKCVFQPVPDGLACDDGIACTDQDACGQGSCLGKVKTCDDGNPCTGDSCDAAKGCVHTPVSGPCSDGDACTIGDVCADGGCFGTAIGAGSCSDGLPCTVDSCDVLQGCVHKAAVDGTACDDGNPCTCQDHCSGGQCAPGNNMCSCLADSDCSKGGNLCTGMLFCDNSKLAACPPGACCGNSCELDPKTVVTCDKSGDTACSEATCNPATGKCSASAVNEGKACEDGSACTQGDSCAGGKCGSGKAISCDDGNACTDDACDNKAGCTHLASNAPCDDGSACTKGDACAGGKCAAGQAISCDDNEPCTQDGCDAQTGCTHTGTPCDDGDVCTTDSCVSGGGCSHSADLGAPGCTTWTADSSQAGVVCANGSPPTIDDAGVLWMLGQTTSCSGGDAYGNDKLVGVDGKSGAIVGSFVVASPNSQPIWRAGHVTMSSDWNWNQTCPGCQLSYNVPGGGTVWQGGQGPHARGGIAMTADGTIYSSYANILAIDTNGKNLWSVGSLGGLGGGTWIGGDGSILGCGTSGTCMLASSGGGAKWQKGLSPNAIAANSAGQWYVTSGSGLQILDGSGNGVGSFSAAANLGVVLLADQGQIVVGAADGTVLWLDGKANKLSGFQVCTGSAATPWLLDQTRTAWVVCGDGMAASVTLDSGVITPWKAPGAVLWIALSADGHVLMADTSAQVRRLAKGGYSYLGSDWPTVDRDARRTRNAKP